MEDMILSARLDESTTLYVSPIAQQTYAEYVGEDNLGGGDGYFVVRSRRQGSSDRIEVLAKAPSFAAAGDLFDLIVGSARRVAPAGR
ncbi:MAG: hypothetical protein GC145_14300 [Caulobacter sp.]|nr:hypothetical protein [Caulobacter sp.]